MTFVILIPVNIIRYLRFSDDVRFSNECCSTEDVAVSRVAALRARRHWGKRILCFLMMMMSMDMMMMNLLSCYLNRSATAISLPTM